MIGLVSMVAMTALRLGALPTQMRMPHASTSSIAASAEDSHIARLDTVPASSTAAPVQQIATTHDAAAPFTVVIVLTVIVGRLFLIPTGRKQRLMR